MPDDGATTTTLTSSVAMIRRATGPPSSPNGSTYRMALTIDCAVGSLRAVTATAPAPAWSRWAASGRRDKFAVMPLFVIDSSPGSSSSERTAAVGDAGGQVRASFASLDGQTGFRVIDSAAAPAGAAWMAVSLAPPARPAGGSLFVVEERFDPPVDLSQAAPENPNLSPCLQRYEVNWFVSYIAADGSQCRCVYSAADAEAVRGAYRSAGMPFVRVWPARLRGAGEPHPAP